MILLFAILFLFKLILSWRYKYGLIINLSSIINDIYLFISFASLDTFKIQTKVLIGFNSIASLIFSFLILILFDRLPIVHQSLKRIAKNNLQPGYIWVLIGFILVGIFFSKGSISDTLLSPRSMYTYMVKTNQSEGNLLFFFIGNISAILCVFANTFHKAIALTCLMFFTGSKGYLIAPFLYFFIWEIYNGQISKKLFFILPASLIGLYYLLNINIKGKDDIISYLIYDYFDYARNINEISNKLMSLWPLKDHWVSSLNEIVLGLSRITNLRRYQFFEEYFPFDFYMGLNPGLLDYENIFRLGIIGYLLFLGLTLILKYSIIRSTSNKLVIATIIIVNLRIGYIFLIIHTLFTLFKKIFRVQKFHNIRFYTRSVRVERNT